MDAFFATFKTYERTIGVNLYSQLKQNAVYAKVRKYPGLDHARARRATTSRWRSSTR